MRLQRGQPVRQPDSGTVDVEGVAVLRTLVSTLAEEGHHLLRLPAEHQLPTAHDGDSAEHLKRAPMEEMKTANTVFWTKVVFLS